MTVKESISLFSVELARIYPAHEIDAITRIALKHVAGLSQADIYVDAARQLPGEAESQIYDIIHQLKRYVPLQYVLGETEFYGLRFLVNENVLIPRPETEELVEWIISDYKERQNVSIIDIGTGSGCIPVALARFLPNAEVSAVDISSEALAMAWQNAQLNGVKINFAEADALKGLPPNIGLFDVIVSNPPYISPEQKDEMLPNVLEFEPHLALFAPEQKPFAFYEAITNLAVKHLKPDGRLYFEINEKYPAEIASIIASKGFETNLRADINDKNRMIKAWKHDKG